MKSLEAAVANLVHNMVSVLAVVALVNGSSKIEPKHLLGATEYLSRKCSLLKPKKDSLQSGGSFPLSYFGGEEPMYLSGNASGATTDTIDYSLGIARAAIQATGTAGQMGGSSGTPKGLKLFEKWLETTMKSTLEHHQVSVSKMAVEQIETLVKRLVACLLKDIAKKSPISAKRVEKTLSKKAYDIFH